MQIDSVLRPLGFAEAYPVAGRTTIADIFRAGRRCGVYVLAFSNGEYYVGKSKNVVVRYGDHRRNHKDIATFQLRELAESEIGYFETRLIEDLERRGFSLRNIRDTSMPKGDSDFDDLMDEQTQRTYLSDHEFHFCGSGRNDDARIRRKNENRAAPFLRRKFANEALSLNRVYITRCVPAYKASEMSFWSLTCFGPGVYGGTALTRININWQEVFTIYSDNDDVFCSMFMCRSVIANEFGDGVSGARRLKKAFPRIEIGEHRYRPGGQDQINLFVDPVSFYTFMRHHTFVKAARLFNMRLMRKGPNNFARSHCFSVVDRIMQGESAPSGDCTIRTKVDELRPGLRINVPVRPDLVAGWKRGLEETSQVARKGNRGWGAGTQRVGPRGSTTQA